MRHRIAPIVIALVLGAGALIPATAAGADAAAWKLTATPMPTNFAPGSSGEIFLLASNVGGTPTSETATLTDTLPEGLTPFFVARRDDDPASAGPSCNISGQTVTCTDAGPIGPGRHLEVIISVNADPLAAKSLLDEASIESGTANATTTTPLQVSEVTPSFGFLPGAAGLSASLTESDGSPATQAGSHPYQLTVDLGFPTENRAGPLTGAGHLHDVSGDLPRGVLGNPTATPVLCTEAQLTTEEAPGCPRASQVGTVTVVTVGVTPEAATSPLFNMVPPPGVAASFGFDALEVGVFAHIDGVVRSDGDFGISGVSSDLLALPIHPVFGIHLELWGNPSSSSHDGVRSACLIGGGSCEVDPQETAFLTMPSECPEGGVPPLFGASAHSWEALKAPPIKATYKSADLSGNPAPVEGCNKLNFEPTIEARPTTTVADSPSGLDFDVHQPQELKLGGEGKSLSTASLKDAKVTFPAGFVVNASSGDGLGACAPTQIGLNTPIGTTPIRFSKEPATCPDSSKLGSVEVSSPLLAQHDAEHKTLRDPEGNAIPEPLHGSVYLAKPFDNPFGSLIAVYFSIADQQTGIVAKFASKVEPNPTTGQLTAILTEAPELPVEDFKVHLFGGARAGLQTPTTCNTYTTTSDLTPWSSPEGLNQHPKASFSTTAVPSGGGCPATDSQLPNAPTFKAGTISPSAGSYSPLIFKLSREDGTQRLTKLDVTLPPGLAAKFAGIAECSEAQIAAAEARNGPNDGALEKASPSCPANSEVGTVNVGAGAGPTPLYVQGHAYLAGPYRGAPYSLVAIVPAVAGPFDLGAVVTRTAIYIDPDTAQGRGVSDPFPTILHGIPVDVRSVALNANRPNFALNPTSCDPKSFTGSAVSILGETAPLSERFQVGGCNALPFKPKLHLRLFGPIHRGGHPRFRTVFEAKPGEANTARIVLALPRSEFIDQAHFRTICTRVQFAAKQCPAGSIYGHVKAITPLLDYPLEGPIYLRSSSHQLPDVVVALRGPASQPVEVDLDGRVDSVNGGLRTTIEAVPDAPVTKAVITLQGAKKGLFQNSTNICKGTHRATLKMVGQNGKAYNSKPLMKADCPKASKKKNKG